MNVQAIDPRHGTLGFVYRVDVLGEWLKSDDDTKRRLETSRGPHGSSIV